MDANIALIVGALVAGLAKVGEQAVQDAYQGLKTLILRKFAGNRKIEGALEGLEEDAETWQKPLETALTEAEAGDDQQLVAAAQRLNSEIEKASGATTMTPSQIGGQGNIQQNIGTVTGGTVIGQQVNRQRDDRSD
jgi:hypothetical protein